jgi:hypothetical protein
MTHDPPKRAPNPAPNYITLVIRGHVQRSLRLQVQAELEKRKIAVFHKGSQPHDVIELCTYSQPRRPSYQIVLIQFLSEPFDHRKGILKVSGTPYL